MTMYDRIRERRIALKMSQDELAKRVGYQSRSAISKVENGDRDISQSMIKKYAEALGVSPAYLLYGEEETSADEKTGGRIEEFIELFSQLSYEQQLFIISSIKGLLSNQRSCPGLPDSAGRTGRSPRSQLSAFPLSLCPPPFGEKYRQYITSKSPPREKDIL